MERGEKPDIFTAKRQASPEAGTACRVDPWVKRRLAWMVPARLGLPLLWNVFRYFFALCYAEPDNPFVLKVLDSVHEHARYWVYRALILHRLDVEGDPCPMRTLETYLETDDPEVQAYWCMERWAELTENPQQPTIPRRGSTGATSR